MGDDLWHQIGVQEGLRRYSQIRKRLRNPPNAVPDIGIDLTRSRQLTPEPPPKETQTPKEDPVDRLIATSLALYPPLERKLTIGLIFKHTATAFGIPPEHIRGRSRKPIYAHPRQVGMYLTRRMLRSSFPIIGTYLGKDHTTVIHAYRMIEAKVAADPEFAAKVDEIEKDLRSRYANHT